MRNKYYIVNVPLWGKVYYIVNLPGGGGVIYYGGRFTLRHRNISAFMTYHWVCKKSNTTGATCGVGNTLPFRIT